MNWGKKRSENKFGDIGGSQPQNRIHEALFQMVALIFLGIWWFFVVLHPWQGFITSDHGLPYLMTQQTWIKQDFYYWGAARFGSLYVVFWKAFGKYLFGPNPMGFYLCHVLIFFIGLGFWLATLNSWLLRVFLLWMFLPVTNYKADEFLFPGQLYGMIFFLTGLYLWISIQKQQNNRTLLVQGVICGLTYWQHELAGTILVVLTAASRIQSFKLKKFFCNKAGWHGIGAFSVVFIPIFAFAEIARSWSRIWPMIPNHLAIEPWGRFVGNLSHFLKHGLRFHGTAIFGHTLFWGCLILGFACLVRLLKRSDFTASEPTGPKAHDPLYLDRLFGCFFLLLICCVILINLNSWYTANLRHDRYYNFLVPLAVFLIVKRADRPYAWSRMKFLAICFTLALVFLSHRPYGKEWVFMKDEKEKRTGIFEARSNLAKDLLDGGCQGYLAPYWEAYALAPLTYGKIPISATDTIRNPPLFNRILNGYQCCTSISLDLQQWKGKASGFQCKKRKSYCYCLKK